jgi:hypothetical protein
VKYKAVWNKIKRLKSLYLYDGGNWLYEKEIGCYVHAVYNMRGDFLFRK